MSPTPCTDAHPVSASRSEVAIRTGGRSSRSAGRLHVGHPSDLGRSMSGLKTGAVRPLESLDVLRPTRSVTPASSASFSAMAASKASIKGSPAGGGGEQIASGTHRDGAPGRRGDRQHGQVTETSSRRARPDVRQVGETTTPARPLALGECPTVRRATSTRVSATTRNSARSSCHDWLAWAVIMDDV